ncbi:MerR family transcriptional regulator [Paenibacillus sp. N1-5-1-14]|uniref:MerR family transcriptional regulator n=1 Tax=Paenibacillus radicibacter TaxID=2972488 RepID=UPI00215927EF|nr:MerR family transcriptional regulator [Paenibacillus radicibacter]MCR8644679.1 MerR family transcriptional regulator [Paenibacillus radicibacter]
MLSNQRFTIGEMAKMHRVAESTLRYYDEKGIFTPKMVDPNTHYRYYTLDQFSTLDHIKFLRHLNIPIKEIKRYMDERTPAYGLELLMKQKELMVEKQKELEYTLMKMNNGIDIIQEALEVPPDKLIIKSLPKRMIASAAIMPNATDEMFEYSIHQLQKKVLQDSKLSELMLYTGAFGVSVAQEALRQGKYQAFNSVFLHLSDIPFDDAMFNSIPAGMFACMHHLGPYEQSASTYELLLREIERNQYEITGDALELSLIDFSMTKNPEEYITELQIPIRRL